MAKKKKANKVPTYEGWFDKYYIKRKSIKGILIMIPSYTCKGIEIFRPGTGTIVSRDNTPLEGHVAEGEIILPTGYNDNRKKFIFPVSAYNAAKNKKTVIDHTTQEETRICKIVNIDPNGNVIERIKKRKRKR